MKNDCYKKICEKCVNCTAVSGILGRKYSCRLNKKPDKNKCFYFQCVGKGSSFCEHCVRYYKLILEGNRRSGMGDTFVLGIKGEGKNFKLQVIKLELLESIKVPDVEEEYFYIRKELKDEISNC